MADADVLARLLTLLGLDNARTLTACLGIARHHTGFSITDTGALNTLYRTLKSRVPAESRAEFEDVFMKMVSRDNGSLSDVLTHVLNQLDGEAVREGAQAVAIPPPPAVSASTARGGGSTRRGLEVPTAAVDTSVSASLMAATTTTTSSSVLLPSRPRHGMGAMGTTPTLAGGAEATVRVVTSVAPATTPTRTIVSMRPGGGGNSSGSVSGHGGGVEGVQPARHGNATRAAVPAAATAVIRAPRSMTYTQAVDAVLTSWMRSKREAGMPATTPSPPTLTPRPTSHAPVLRHGDLIRLSGCRVGVGSLAVTSEARGVGDGAQLHTLLHACGGAAGGEEEAWRLEVQGATGAPRDSDTVPLACGATVQLRHVSTGKLLCATGQTQRHGAELPATASPEAVVVGLSTTSTPRDACAWIAIAPAAVDHAAAPLLAGHTTVPATTAIHADDAIMLVSHYVPTGTSGGGEPGGEAWWRTALSRAFLLTCAMVDVPPSITAPHAPPQVPLLYLDRPALPPSTTASGMGSVAASSIMVQAVAACPFSCLWQAVLLYRPAPAAVAAPPASDRDGVECTPRTPGQPWWGPLLARPGMPLTPFAVDAGKGSVVLRGEEEGQGEDGVASTVHDATSTHAWNGEAEGAEEEEGVVVAAVLDALVTGATLMQGSEGFPPGTPTTTMPVSATWLLMGDRTWTPPAWAALPSRLSATSRHFVRLVAPLIQALRTCGSAIAHLAHPAAGGVANALASAAGFVCREFLTTVLSLEGQVRHGQAATLATALPVASRPGYSPHAPLSAVPSPGLTLQQLWFHCQPALRTMTSLATMLHAVATAPHSGDGMALGMRQGGAILAALTDLVVTTGDTTVKALASFALERCSAPYLRHLNEWLFVGTLSDPCLEFMVAQGAGSDGPGGAAWQDRFVCVDHNVPAFLRPHAQSILLAGKYLNAYRACMAAAAGVAAGDGTAAAGAGSSPTASWLPCRVAPYAAPITWAGVDPEAYAPFINTSVATAASLLLQHFTSSPARQVRPDVAAAFAAGSELKRVGLGLYDHLLHLKSYFLLHRGDVMTAFLELSEQELGLEVAPTAPTPPAAKKAATSLPKLQSCLDMALRASGGVSEGVARRLHVTLSHHSLLAYMDHLRRTGAPPPPAAGAMAPSPATAGLRGYNTVTLQYTAEWPLSLVLSPGVMGKYSALFRHLFLARYVERAVCGCWVQHQSCKELSLRPIMALSYALRQRMLHFLHNITYYMLAEVIEPLWHEMAGAMRLATSIDDVMACHDAFLARAMEGCLLTAPDVLKLLTKLITLCLLFSSQISQSIETHRLSSEELDRRAGLNKASQRARHQLERGDYYDSDEGDGDDTARSVASRVTTATLRSKHGGVGGSDAPRAKSGATKERERRKARLAVQAQAMTSTMAQHGWQAMIAKSSKMFDALLRDFLVALYTRTRGDYSSSLMQLCARLDHNQFYTRHLGIAAAAVGVEDGGGASGGESEGAGKPAATVGGGR